MKYILPFLVAFSLFAQAPAAPDAATPPIDPPIDPWASSLGAGLSITSGNSDTMNLNFAANTTWDPKTTRLFKAEALYLVGESEGEKQVDKLLAKARYEQLFNERAFWFAEAPFLRDPFREINYLVSPLVGAGYHVVSTPVHKLTFDGAVGAILEDKEITGQETSGAVKVGETYEWTISELSKVSQKVTGIWNADDFGDALYHFDASLTTALAARLELKLSYVYDYETEPAPGVEEGDSALFAAVLVKF